MDNTSRAKGLKLCIMLFSVVMMFAFASGSVSAGTTGSLQPDYAYCNMDLLDPDGDCLAEVRDDDLLWKIFDDNEIVDLRWDFSTVGLSSDDTITNVMVHIEGRRKDDNDAFARIQKWDETVLTDYQEWTGSSWQIKTFSSEDLTDYVISLIDSDQELSVRIDDSFLDANNLEIDYIWLEIEYDDTPPECDVDYMYHEDSHNEHWFSSYIWINEEGEFLAYGWSEDTQSDIDNVQYNRTSPDTWLPWNDADPVDGSFNSPDEDWQTDPNDDEFIEGEHTICCRGIDDPGNVGDGECESFCIDVTPPSQPGTPVHEDDDICELADEDLFDNDDELNWEWTDSTDEPECSGVDYYNVEIEEDCDGDGNYDDTDDDQTAGSEPSFEYSNVAEGCYYRIRVQAVDMATNEGPWSAWSEWTLVDWSAPSIDFAPDSADYPSNWYSDDFDVEIHMYDQPDDDDNSGLCICEYEIFDNGAPSRDDSFECFCNEEWTEDVEITVGPGQDCETIGEDTCELYAYAEDKAGNINEYSEYYSIDYEPPETDKYIGDPQWEEGEFVTTETPFWFEADDGDGVGVDETYYRMCFCEEWDVEDECPGGWEVYEGGFIYFEEESCHMLEFYSIDYLENEEEVTSQRHYVDDSPPVTEKWYGIPNFLGWRWIQGVEMWIHYITMSTPIFFDAYDCGDADDCEEHPVGVESTWWNLYVPTDNPDCEQIWWFWWWEGQYLDDPLWCMPEAYIDGEFVEYWEKPFWNCIDQYGEGWVEHCNITWWEPKYGGDWLFGHCYDEPRWKHGTWWCEYWHEPIFIDQECDHKICYFSEDYLWNQEDFHCQVVSVDDTPPEIVEIYNPDYPEETNITKCVQSIVVVVEDEKTGVAEVWAELINDEDDTVRNETLTHTIYDTWEGLMNKELPAGEYTLRIHAKDNLGNSDYEDVPETLQAGVFVEYLDPSTCSVDVDTGGECLLTFHVCVRDANSIKFYLDKIDDLITPAMLDATVYEDDPENDAYVGLQKDGTQLTDAGLLFLEPQPVNGREDFDLGLTFTPYIAEQIGPGPYDLDYLIEAFNEPYVP